MDLNPEIDTTKFVNIDDKKFVFYINKQPREVESGEEKFWPVFVCQIGAKHLVDRILQEKHGIKDTNKDSELRKSIFAKILPDMAQDKKIVPLTPEEEKEAVQKELKRQGDIISSLTEKAKDDEDKDKEMDSLRKEIEELKQLVLKKVAKDK